MVPRYLLVTADDFGIGLETSRGILDLAGTGAITSTVLLVNSPHAAAAVEMWKQRDCPIELGWHPCLTLDSPVLPPPLVPSLVDDRGQFLTLGRFLKKLMFGRINRHEVEAELNAQYDRFRELVGHSPRNVNAHHHVHIFPAIGEALGRVLSHDDPPFVRRVVESWRTLVGIPGARLKRALLSRFGRRIRQTFPGNDRLIGITNPPCVHQLDFFRTWLHRSTGQFVELTCHPGYLDASLAGRDGTLADGQLHRRAAELQRLSDPLFLETVREAGFTLVTAQELASLSEARGRTSAGSLLEVPRRSHAEAV